MLLHKMNRILKHLTWKGLIILDLARYVNIINAVIVWAVVFIVIKPKRIKELLPIAVLSALILFVFEMFLHGLDLAMFNNPLLPIAGTPFFHLVWGAGSGLIFVYFMKEEFSKKIFVILIFALITGVFGFISEKVGNHSHLGKFNDLYNFAFDYVTLVFLIWIAEGLFMRRIYPNALEK